MDAELRSTLTQMHDEVRRHFDVVGESLRADLRLLAEGYAGLQHQIDDLRVDVRAQIETLRQEMHLVTGALGSDIRDLRDSHRDLATSHRAVAQEVGELTASHRMLASDVRTAQTETVASIAWSIASGHSAARAPVDRPTRHRPWRDTLFTRALRRRVRGPPAGAPGTGVS